MIISHLLKNRFSSTLLTLLIILQASACSTEESQNVNTSTATDGIITLSDFSLAWIAPDAREDDTVLLPSEIAGYRVYYGTAPGDYQYDIDINNNSVVSYTFEDFPRGTYYIVVTTYDTDGRESLYSSEVVISI